jgi:hypothetical protein
MEAYAALLMTAYDGYAAQSFFFADTSRSTQPLIQPAIYHLAFIIYNFSRNRVRMRSEQFSRSGV